MTTRERLEGREVAHGRVDEEDGPEERAGRGGEAGAEGEGGGVDALDAHPHERRRLAVLEGRPHGPPEPGAREQEVRAEDEEPGRREDEQAQRRHRHRTQHQRLGGERRGHALGHAAPHQQLGVLEGDPQADHDEHGGVDRRAPQRAEEHALAQGARATPARMATGSPGTS